MGGRGSTEPGLPASEPAPPDGGQAACVLGSQQGGLLPGGLPGFGEAARAPSPPNGGARLWEPLSVPLLGSPGHENPQSWKRNEARRPCPCEAGCPQRRVALFEPRDCLWSKPREQKLIISPLNRGISADTVKHEGEGRGGSQGVPPSVPRALGQGGSPGKSTRAHEVPTPYPKDTLHGCRCLWERRPGRNSVRTPCAKQPHVPGDGFHALRR